MGEPLYLLAISEDITERKQAEKEKVRLASFPQLNPNPIIEVDAVGHIHYANPSATKLLPTLEKEDFRHPWLAGLESLFATFQEAGRGFTVREIKIGESWYYQSLYYVPAIQCIRIYALNITNRKKAEEALRQSEERFKQVSENACEWIWEVNKNGLYTYASPVIKEILGYKPEEIVNKKYFYDLFIPEVSEQLKLLAFESFKRKESFKNFINENLHKDGRKIILSSSGVPILDNEGNLIGYRGVDVDITEQKQAEMLLRENETSLQFAQEIAEMGSWEWDIITNETRWSDNYFAILGLKPGEVEPSFQFYRKSIHPDDVHLLDISYAN
jgi:PAS domain S-box-containing protein